MSHAKVLDKRVTVCYTGLIGHTTEKKGNHESEDAQGIEEHSRWCLLRTRHANRTRRQEVRGHLYVVSQATHVNDTHLPRKVGGVGGKSTGRQVHH